ncbi:MAG: calcium-binding protein [Cyanophyceae cyanobacterium]
MDFLNLTSSPAPSTRATTAGTEWDSTPSSAVGFNIWLDGNTSVHGVSLLTPITVFADDENHAILPPVLGERRSLSAGDRRNLNTTGTSNDDVLTGTAANDTIIGGSGNDSALGLEGADILFGNRESDSLFGNQGNDSIFGGRDEDFLLGGRDGDLINGNLGNDFVGGNRGDDTVFGGRDSDSVFGGKGNDLIYGDLGGDLLSGDLGQDTLFGGAGSDRFVLRPGAGDQTELLSDMVADFERGVDQIQLGGGITLRDVILEPSAALPNSTVVRQIATGEILGVIRNTINTQLAGVDFGEPTTLPNYGSAPIPGASPPPATGGTPISGGISTPNSAPSGGATSGGTAAPGSIPGGGGSPAPASTPTPTSTPPTPIPTPNPTPAPGGASLADVGGANLLNNGDSLGALTSRGNAAVSQGNTTFVAGYAQVSGNNQNPRIARFDNGVRTWLGGDNYESGGADSVARGLLWDGGRDLYAVFSIDGAQAPDFRRFSGSGWINSYGNGGGPSVSVLARLNPNTGAIEQATYLRAELSSGRTNTLRVNNLSFDGSGNVVVNASSFFSPLRADRTRFNCSGSSPFDYTVTLSPDLSSALSASASGCS